MGEIGIDISHQTSKSMEQFLNEDFDYIITLCDHAANFCPTFPGQGKRLHWPLEDPAAAIGTIGAETNSLSKNKGSDQNENRGSLKVRRTLTKGIFHPRPVKNQPSLFLLLKA